MKKIVTALMFIVFFELSTNIFAAKDFPFKLGSQASVTWNVAVKVGDVVKVDYYSGYQYSSGRIKINGVLGTNQSGRGVQTFVIQTASSTVILTNGFMPSDAPSLGGTFYSVTINGIDINLAEVGQANPADYVVNNLQAVQVATGFKITWSPVVGNGLASYHVLVDGSDVGSTNSTSFTYATSDYGLHTYQIAPVTVLEERFYSDTEEITLEPPEIITLNVISVSWNKVILGWSLPGDVKTVDLYKNGLKLTTIGDVTYSDSAITPDSEYKYYLSYVDKYGRQLKTEEIKVSVPVAPEDRDPPGKPKGFTAIMSQDYSYVLLSWLQNDEADIDGYNLFVQEGENWKPLNKKPVTVISYNWKDFKPDADYNFIIVAVDISGNASDPATATIHVPTRDTTSDQQPTPDYLLVTWSETAGAVSYDIYLNGRKVSSVGPDVRSFKITRDMGYQPGNLNNSAVVKAVFADGSVGGGTGGGGSKIDWGIKVTDIWQGAVAITKQFGRYILLGLVLAFVPVIINLLRMAVARRRAGT